MAGKPEPEATPEMTAKMMAKMLECDPKKIDDIMCPKEEAIMAEKDAKKQAALMMGTQKCMM